MTHLAFVKATVSLGKRTILPDLTLSFEAGECVGIVGPNGSGKSTLMRAATGLIPLAAGRITVLDQSLSSWPRSDLARKLSYVPQGGQIHWPMTVRDIVALGRVPHPRSSSDDEAVARALRSCAIEEFADRPVTDLSGGERARVLLARALAAEPEILLADEPFAQLDPHHQLHAMELLQAQAASGALIMVVLHDLSIAARHCSRIVMLSEGRVAADGPPADVLTSDNLRRTFGVDAFIGEHAGAPVILPVKRRIKAL